MSNQRPSCAAMFFLGLIALAAGAYAPVARALEFQAAHEHRPAAGSEQAAAGPSDAAQKDDPAERPPCAVLVQPYCTLDRNARAMLPSEAIAAVTPVHARPLVPRHRPRSELAHDSPSPELLLESGGLLTEHSPHAPPRAGA